MGTFQREMISAARPRVMAAKAMAFMQQEREKGCTPDLSTRSGPLEPPFEPISQMREAPLRQAEYLCLPAPQTTEEDLLRFQVWISPDYQFDWLRSELFLKSILDIRHRMGWEIMGNAENIRILIFCHRDDEPILHAAFESQFENCALSESSSIFLTERPETDWAQAVFTDMYPPPPYSHLFTQPGELRLTPYETLITVLSRIPPPAIGFSQVLFEPVSIHNDWHTNVETLLSLDYRVQLMLGNSSIQRYPQQDPSNALLQKSREVEAKAHNDKPFFAAALRLGVLGAGSEGARMLDGLSTFTGPFLHGGRRMRRLTEAEYARIMTTESIRDMFVRGLTYRGGFLMNSSELAGLVNLPTLATFTSRNIVTQNLEILPATNPMLSEGSVIGYSKYADTITKVCIPSHQRCCSAHYIGRPNMGKSTAMSNQIIQDILEGNGLAVLDPHGDLIQSILPHVPEEQVYRIIYMDPGDPEFVPLWNPLKPLRLLDPGRLADDLLASFKHIVDGWGDRLETILRYSFLGLLSLKDITLQDTLNLLRRDSRDGKALKKQILEMAENENVHKFWHEDFGTYQKNDLGPPKHKLSKLLSSGTCARMLSQPESKIDIQNIMDEGKVLLVNLSNLGSEQGDILGSFILSLFHLVTLGRSPFPEGMRKPFNIFCDEAYRYATHTLDSMIVASRKYNVGLILAHQYLSQFTTSKRDALASVGTTLIFNVDTKDARHLTKDLQNKASVEDIITLRQGEAIAKINTEIVRLHTLPPRKIPEAHFRKRIISESRRRYCKHKDELEADKNRKRHGRKQFVVPPHAVLEGDFSYEEF